MAATRIGEEHQRQDEEDPLGVAVGAEQDQRPDGDGGDRDGEVAADAEQLEGGADAGELRHDQAHVGHDQADQGEGGDAQARTPPGSGRPGPCR